MHENAKIYKKTLTNITLIGELSTIKYTIGLCHVTTMYPSLRRSILCL